MAGYSKRQEEIIHAACRVITDQGVTGLTTKSLSEEMDFSEAALYRHFPYKEHFVLAVLDYLTEDMDGRLESVSKKDPVNEFEDLFFKQYSFFSDHPYFVAAIFCDGLLEESEEINDKFKKLNGVKMKHLLPILQRGQAEGAFRTDLSTEELLHMVIGAFRLLMYQWRIARFEFDIEQQGSRVTEKLLLLLKPGT